MKEMFSSVGISLPSYRVRDIKDQLAEREVSKVSKAEFAQLCQEVTQQDVRRTFKTSKQHDRDGVKIEGEMGATHMVLHEEQAAFADWINSHLGNDPQVAHKLKLAEGGGDLYEKMDDGVILCKMINLAAPDTIDERVINTGRNIPIFKVSDNTLSQLSHNTLSQLSHNSLNSLTTLCAATREPDPGHQLCQGYRLCCHRHRQSHSQLRPGQEVAGTGPGLAAHQDVPLQEHLHQPGTRAGQPPQGRSVTSIILINGIL